MPDFPLAYFITISCYGHVVQGEGESVDRRHSQPGQPFVPANAKYAQYSRNLMDQSPYSLDEARREIVLRTLHEVCRHREWDLLAVHVRSNHFHVLVRAGAPPEKVMNDFKVYCSRRLSENGYDEGVRKRWSRHGSTRYLWKPEDVSVAQEYVLKEQGDPMSVYRSETL